MILRLAWYLAACWRPEHRWRRVAVPLSAGVAAVLFLAALSVWVAFGRQAERVAGRVAVFADQSSPTDTFFIGRADEWAGIQYAVNWIEPVTAGSSVLPPGIDAWPEPGGAVVSPALARLIEREPSLAARYPAYALLADEGLADAGELLAWVRPRDSDGLGDLGGSFRIRTFGDGGAPGGALDYSIVATPDQSALLTGITTFLAVPGALVLVLGLASASRLRAERLAILGVLGAGRSWMAKLVVAEALLLVLPPVVLVGFAWGVVTPRLGRVPVAGKEVVRGDLSLGPVVLVAAMAAIAAIAAASVLLTTVVAERLRRDGQTGRPTPAGRAGSPLRVLPLVAALGVVLYAGVLGMMGKNASGQVMIYGFGGMIVALPFAVPSLVRPVGLWLADRESVPASLAGRRLAWDPVRTGRPFTVLAALVVTACMVLWFLANLGDTVSSARAGEAPSAALVTWYEGDSESLDALRAALPEEEVVPFAQDRSGILLGSTCQELAVPMLWREHMCDPERPDFLSEPAARELSDAFWGQPVHLRPVDRTQVDGRVSVAIVSTRDGSALAKLVRGALPLASFPGLFLTSAETFALREPALARWTDYGIVVAIAAAGLACWLSLVDRIIATRGGRRFLVDVGLTPRAARAVEAWSFLAPYAAVVAGAMLVGLANIQAARWVQGGPVPLGGLAVMVGLLSAGGAVAAAAVALLGDA